MEILQREGHFPISVQDEINSYMLNFLTSGYLSQENRSEVQNSGIVLSCLEKPHFRMCLLGSSINEGVFTYIKVVLIKI